MPIPFTAPHSTIPSSPPHAATVSSSNSSNNGSNNSSSTNNIVNGNNHGTGSTSPIVGRLGLSTTHGRIQTQTLDSRRWSRLQRRSPLDSHHPHAHPHNHNHNNHHSPRTRYFASFAPTTPLSNRASRSPLLSSQLDSPQSQRFSPSSPPHVRDNDMGVTQQQQQHQTHMQQQQQQRQGDAPTPYPPFPLTSTPSLPPNAHSTAVSNLLPEQSLLPSSASSPPTLLPMESSRPSESFNTFLANGASASASIGYNDSAHGTDPRSRTFHPALSSTPMQRSLTNNPIMALTFSSIHAASMDPTSVSVSVSVSTTPTPATSASGVGSDNNSGRDNNHNNSNNSNATTTNIRTHASSRSNSSDGIVTASRSNFNSRESNVPRHQFNMAQSTATSLPSFSSSSSTIYPSNNNTDNSNNRNIATQSTRSEVDERIHFRLLDGIYFSAPPRPARHDDDLGMDSPPQPQRRSDLQYIDTQDTNFSDHEDEYMHDNNAMEDLDFGDSSLRNTMYDNQGDDFASATFRQRSSHPELVEEEDESEEPRQRNGRQHNTHMDDDEDDDDEDDGIDQVMEGHRHSAALVRSPSSSLPSHLERPQHAQLSPRSAAALTSMFALGRSPWPQPLISSSITSELIAMTQPGARSGYDNNPYFRRPGVSYHGQTENDRQMDTSSSSHSRRTSMPDRPHRQSTISGPGNAFRPRSFSTQYEAAHHAASSSHHQYGRRSPTDARGCGEVNSAASLEAQGDVWPLRFDMYYADGGEFNAAHSVENVLKNDSSVYCSRRSTNINICLKLSLPQQTFVLTQFKAKAPTTGFTAPCKEGLIFISHEPIQLEKTAFFDNMTRQMYEEYMATVQPQTGYGQMYQNHGADTDALIPAAFFQLGGPDETCTVDFTPNRSGRYVLIKLLRSRCTNSLQRPENIDLQYLGLIGFTGARSFASGGLL